jgi:serine/threonine-protein kinase
MASVWRATDTTTGVAVAVKRLHARLQDDDELMRRFQREGAAVARLSHPNLVRLLDQGGDAVGEPFLVFELVDGRDLKTIIRQHGRLPPERAATVCAQVARALAAAHDQGVVHRDIKSHNVLVTNDGVAKLTDFGIARIIEADTVGLTKTGIVLGSSDYLAPEQAEGKDVGPRGDIYSLGVVLFEALTGRLPFTGENPVAIATKHVYEAPPNPRAIEKEIPKDLAGVCLRAMAKDPSDRFPSAAALADALDGGRVDSTRASRSTEEPTTARMRALRGGPPRTERRQRGLAILGIGALAIAGAVGLWRAGVFGGDDGADPATPQAVGFIPAAHDPLGDQGENDGQVSSVSDANVNTTWQTENYRSAGLGGIKAGVGLRLTLSTPTRVTAVRLSSTTPGGAVQILGPGGDTSDQGNPRPVLGQGEIPDGDGEIRVTDPAGPAVNEIIVWFTELPNLGGGSYRAVVGEVAVVGVANR